MQDLDPSQRRARLSPPPQPFLEHSHQPPMLDAASVEQFNASHRHHHLYPAAPYQSQIAFGGTAAPAFAPQLSPVAHTSGGPLFQAPRCALCIRPVASVDARATQQLHQQRGIIQQAIAELLAACGIHDAPIPTGGTDPSRFALLALIQEMEQGAHRPSEAYSWPQLSAMISEKWEEYNHALYLARQKLKKFLEPPSVRHALLRPLPSPLLHPRSVPSGLGMVR
jgi:hypothetical protein